MADPVPPTNPPAPNVNDGNNNQPPANEPEPFNADKFIKTIQAQIDAEERAKADEELRKNTNITKELYKHFQDENKKLGENYAKEKEVLQKQIEVMQKQIEDLGKPKGSQSPEPTGQPPLTPPNGQTMTSAERAKLVLRKMGVNC